MSVVLRAIGFANGVRCPHAGQYLKWFDHEANEGGGYGLFTPHRYKAMRFADAGEALAFWQRQSTVRPLRADGQPNRPLSCLTVEVVT